MPGLVFHVGAGDRHVLADLTAAGATRKAQQLRVVAAGSGLPIGRTVVGRRPLFSTWDDMAILVAGPRTPENNCVRCAGDPRRARRVRGDLQ